MASVVVVALVAFGLGVVAPAAPAAADGNEAPGAPAAARSISTGGAHSCAVLPTGRVKCWGSGANGRLGQGSTASLGDAAGEMAALPPVDLGAGRTATAVTTGGAHTCALLDDATVKCWGAGGNGRLGQGSTADVGDGPGEVAALPPVFLGSGRTATAVTAGDAHTCALLDNGTVKCWGFGASGRLGQGSTADLGDDPGEMLGLAPVNLGAGRTATAISAGGSHTCALLDDGTVRCWGFGFSGALGQGSTADLGDAPGEMAGLAPVNLGAGRTATAISAGTEHSCALLDDGSVKCWGAGGSGRLGQDSVANLGDAAGEMAALAPVNLGAGRTATAISAGGAHTCASLDDASVKCWGAGGFGRLGQGSVATLGDAAGEMAALAPVDLGAGRTADAITTGEFQSCAVLDDASVKCWGRGTDGRLGQGSVADLGDQVGEVAGLTPVLLLTPSLAVTQTADRVTARVGDPITFSITVANTGSATLTGVTVADLNAPGCNGPVPDLAVGEERSVNCSYTATSADLGRYTNVATADSAQTAPVDSNQVVVAVTPLTQIAAGGAHTCAVVEDGSVRCWGSGASGRLGYANTNNIGDNEVPGLVGPVNVGAGRTAVSVTAGDAHACALLDDGSVRCWGLGSDGRLGYDNQNNIGDNEVPGSVGPVQLGAGRRAVSVTAGGAHTCALLDDGTVRCWGLGADGRLGYANTTSIGDDEKPGTVGPVDLGAGRTAVSVTAGGAHTCALLDDGSVRCWGLGADGRLGYGNTNNVGDDEVPGSVGPVDLGAGRTAVSVTAGGAHTCALLDNATVRCWGSGQFGQLGYGNTNNIGDDETPGSVNPVVVGGTNLAIAAGDFHTCAIKADRFIRCWGSGAAGRLGNGNQNDIGDDEIAASGGTVDLGDYSVSVTAGGAHTCALLVNGTVRCWGLGLFGRLGYANQNSIGDDESPGSVGPVRLGAGRRAVVAGDAHTCAISGAGSVRCWGLGADGRLGYANTASIGDDETPAAVGPVDVGAGRTALAVTAGSAHSCAVLDDGSVRCWGSGASGELGYGNTASIGDDETPGSVGPVNLGAGRTAVAVTAGDKHTCALLDNGSVRCWGDGSNGRLGYGNTASIGDDESPGSVGPVNLGAGRTAVAIAAGGAQTCALLDNGSVRCWGLGSDGRLGYANTNNIGDDEVPGSVGPVNLGAGRSAVSVTAGDAHTCALLDDGSVRCWGSGAGGQLGYGNTTSIGDDETPGSVGPVSLGAGRTAVAVTGGDKHTCAVLDDGSVRCWGDGSNGRLGYGNSTTIGDNETPGSVGPVDLGAGRTAVSVTAGVAHTCALLDDDTVRCWGLGADGRLGYADQNNIGDNETPGSVGPVILTPVPALSVAASADETAVVSGDTVHLHVTVTNTGNVALTGVTISSVDAPDCAVAPFVLAIGADQTVDCTYTATVGDAPVYRFSVSVVSAEVTTPVTSNEVEVAVRPATASELVTAGGTHSCAILPTGHVKCWGSGFNGQLGQGSTADVGDQPGEMAALAPVNLGAGRTATAVSAGEGHTCALLDDGSVKCWGTGASGVLGQGSTANLGDQGGEMAALAPVNLGAGRTATAISAGSVHTCALLDDGSVKCWGRGTDGRLGQGSTANLGDQGGEMAALAPVNLGAGRTATAISAGASHTCALLDDGSVKCWGSALTGQLGQGSTANLGDQPGEMAALAPVNLGAGRTATAISAGSLHTCAVLDDGTVKCWGYNASGQLGQGSTADVGDQPGEMAALAPVDLGAGRTAVTISAGLLHTCALLDDATVKCWGSGANGRLGQDSTATLGDEPGEMAALAPVDLGAGRLGTAVDAGFTHTCAVLDDASVKCWGNGGNGRLGQDSTASLGDEPGEMAALAPVDLTLPPSGVAGTVTEVGSGAPLGGVWMAVLRTADFSVAAGAVADGSGAFAADLAPGTYFLYLVDPSGVHPAGFFGAPTLVTVTEGVVVRADPTMVSLRGSITATVTEAGTGDPIAGVWGLALSGSAANAGATELVVDGDGSGAVALTGLVPGSHFVGFVDPTGTHETRFFPDSPNVPDATMVGVTAGQASIADAALPPQVAVGTGAVISGTVTEEGTGVPIASARVVALRAADYRMVRGATADGSGHYELDLAPGEYKLAVLDGAGGHEMEWFDDLGSTELGSAVSVTAPGTADAALASTRGAVAGTITDDPSGDPLEGAWVIAIGPSGIAGGAVTAVDGTYRVDGLATGTYRVTVADPVGGRRQEFYDDAVDVGGAVPLSVVAGGTVTVDAALALPPP